MNDPWKTILAVVSVPLVGIPLGLGAGFWLCGSSAPPDIPKELADEARPLYTKIVSARDLLSDKQKALVRELDRGRAIAVSLFGNASPSEKAAAVKGVEGATMSGQSQNISKALTSLLASSKEQEASCTEAARRLKEIGRDVIASGIEQRGEDVTYIGEVYESLAENHCMRINRLTEQSKRQQIQAALDAIKSVGHELEKRVQPAGRREFNQEVDELVHRYADCLFTLDMLTRIYMAD